MKTQDEIHFRKCIFALGGPQDEDAFHSLLEFDGSWIPRLIKACEDESDPGRKASLIQIIWRSQKSEYIPFLGEMLLDPHDKVWKSALDGLVAFNNAKAKEEIVSAMTKCPDLSYGRRVEWFNEAITQMQDANENR